MDNYLRQPILFVKRITIKLSIRHRLSYLARILSFMKTLTHDKIYLCWRKCEHISQSGSNEWRFDENGLPVRLGYYNQIDKQGGWFVKEDEQHNLHICSFDTIRTIL